MSGIAGNSCQDLFACAPHLGDAQQLKMRVLSKAGTALMFLPVEPGMAAAALTLYPAQRRPARCARTLLGWALNARLPLPLRETSLTIHPRDPFAQFLSTVAGSEPGQLPPLAILAGNPNAPGRRHTILVFGADKAPRAVVKAGCTEPARQLIGREQSLLVCLPEHVTHAPKVSHSFSSPQVAAFATDFFAGHSPRRQDRPRIAAMLNEWLDTTRTVRVEETEPWQQLQRACKSHGLFAQLAKKLQAAAIHPALWHGDLAPWNIRVSPAGDSMVVLDWERGQRTGLPGWDWFHYVLQPAILVGRQSAPALCRVAQQLLATDSFVAYAQRAGMAGLERELLLAYLLYGVEVLQPGQGGEPTRRLLLALSQRWLGPAGV